MSYTTNRLKEALAKLADVDEAIGDLMRCEKSATDNLKAAGNHTRAATALLEAQVVGPCTRALTPEERRAFPTGYTGQKAPRFVSEQDGCIGYGQTEAESRHQLRRELSYITRHKEDRP
ncbi:MAG: hypothetical protein OXM01_07320 [Gemmatimonadota bacterium]|nr:hypothetical protein [Gemmatimonadota bacterium]